MSKFKKGDWVRVLHTDFEDEFPVDSVAQVHEADRVVFLMHASGKLCFYDSELEPWQPKVGDRVQVNYGHGWCGEGVVVNTDWCISVKITTGAFAGTTGGFNLANIEPLPAPPVAAEAQPAAWTPKVGDRVTANENTHVNIEQHWNVHFRSKHGGIIDGALVVASVGAGSDSNVGLSNKLGRSYFYMPANTLKPAASPAPLKIEAGKFYKTRDGRKVGPMEAFNVGKWIGWAGKHGEISAVFEAGGKHGDGDDIHNTPCIHNEPGLDLIAEWVEPAAAKVNVAATVDYQADEYGSGVRQAEKPKFRVGDKVDYLRDRDGQWLGVTIDRVEMTSFGTMGYWGRGKNGHTGLFEGDDIVLSRPITQPTAIVARIDNGQPRPNPTPFVHHSQEAAAKEAARLANLHKGQKFGVYVLTGEPVFVEREYKFTWQKMAARNDVPAAIDELSRAAGIARSDAHFAVRNWLEAA